MSEFFDVDGPFFSTIKTCVDMVYLTALFIITSIPIFTIGASMCAMYYTANKAIRHDRSYVGKEYFRAFKENFKQSTPVWIVLMIVYIVLGAETYIMYQYAIDGQTFGRVYLLLMGIIVVIIVWNVYLFAYMSRFKNTTRNCLKNALIFTTGSFWKSFVLFALMFFCLLLVVSWPVLVVFVPGAYTVVATFLIEKVFEKYMTPEQKAEEFEKNRVYKN